MLTTSRADHFRTFGFVVLRGYLADRIGALSAETGAAIRDAYAATYVERVIDGISGHYVPMASRLTPVSTSLICDDPRLLDAAEELLGGPVIPECPEGVLYFAEASWHADAAAYQASFPDMSRTPQPVTWSPSTCIPGMPASGAATGSPGRRSTSAAP